MSSKLSFAFLVFSVVCRLNGFSFPFDSQVNEAEVTVCTNSRGELLAKIDGGDPCEKEIARAELSNQINSTGWAFINVETFDEEIPWHVQAYAAGYAEGRVSRDLISMHIQNTVYGYCTNATDYCERLADFLLKNYLWMLSQIENNTNDPYWIQVNFTINQLLGLIDGYEREVGFIKSARDLSIHPVYLLQLAGDREDLEVKLKRPENLLSRLFGSGHCSGFVKVAPDNLDLFFSHVTWTSYSTMLRMQKRYSFKMCKGQNPGHTVTMSGYPGTLSSNDDFVLTSAMLGVFETTISNYNEEILKFITPNTIFVWIRSQIANRVADTTISWAKMFRKHNSGTYNNQWIIVDYKKFREGKALPKTGLIRIVEQLPGVVEHADVSASFAKRGYWASYNCPYFENIFNISGTWKQVEKFGDWFTYDRNPRALIFARDQSSVTNMESLKKLMRSNDYQRDPLSRCNCTPPYSAENAISCRSDLNPANGSYPFPALGFRDHGATDMKATNATLIKKLAFEAISGPTYNPLPIFDWDTAAFKETVSHVGQPQQFRFPMIVHDWPEPNE